MNGSNEQKYYRVPKVLLTDQYDGLSAEAVLLYGVLSDRSCLSQANMSKATWVTPNGEVYIYFTLEDIQQRLHCGHDKATKTCRELELVGLIKRLHVGRGKPYKIVVYPPVSRSGRSTDSAAINPFFRCGKSADNNTDILLTDGSNNTDQTRPEETARGQQYLVEDWDVVAAYNTLYDTYPAKRKGDYDKGLAAYYKVVTTQMDAAKVQESLSKWISAAMWQKDGGRYIPLLSNYLLRGYADKQVPTSVPLVWGSGELGEEEMEAIKRMMSK